MQMRIWGLVAALLPATGVWPAAAEEKYTVSRDVPYVDRGGESLLADVYVPPGAGPFPTVLVVHGGAWMTGNKSRMSSVAIALAEHGYTACSINYRLAPKHPFPAQIEDCKTAVRWLRSRADQYKVDTARVAGYGYSAGGHLVSLLGATDAADGLEGPDAQPDSPSTRLQAVVAGGAPCEFRVIPADNQRLAYWLGGSRAEKPDAYALASPLKFVTQDDPPSFYFHGTADSLVPLASPAAMVAKLKFVGVPAELLTLDGAGHIEAYFDKSATTAAIEFLDKQLKKEEK